MSLADQAAITLALATLAFFAAVATFVCAWVAHEEARADLKSQDRRARYWQRWRKFWNTMRRLNRVN